MVGGAGTHMHTRWLWGAAARAVGCSTLQLTAHCRCCCCCRCRRCAGVMERWGAVLARPELQRYAEAASYFETAASKAGSPQQAAAILSRRARCCAGCCAGSIHLARARVGMPCQSALWYGCCVALAHTKRCHTAPLALPCLQGPSPPVRGAAGACRLHSRLSSAPAGFAAAAGCAGWLPAGPQACAAGHAGGWWQAAGAGSQTGTVQVCTQGECERAHMHSGRHARQHRMAGWLSGWLRPHTAGVCCANQPSPSAPSNAHAPPHLPRPPAPPSCPAHLLCCSYLLEHGSECRGPVPSAAAAGEQGGSGEGAGEGPAQGATNFHTSMLHL